MTDKPKANEATSASSSTIIVVRMHADDAARFLDAFRNGQLDKFNVSSVEIEPPDRWTDTVQDQGKKRGSPDRG